MVLTFWFNSHFGPKIDFVTNVVPNKKKKKNDTILVPAVNLLTRTSYMANRSTGGIGNADVAIKIILKKYHVSILFKKINLSILAKLKNKKTKLKT